MDKTIISPSGHQITYREIVEASYQPDVAHAITEQDYCPEGPTLEQRVAELERKLHDLHYQLCVHVTTEG